MTQQYVVEMPIDALAAFILAAVFVMSAVAKVRQPTAIAQAASEMLGRSLPSSLGAVVICVEFMAALLLAVSSTRAAGAVLSLVVLATFSVTIFRSLRAGRTPRCACFGNIGAAAISSTDLVRNGALMMLATLVLVA